MDNNVNLEGFKPIPIEGCENYLIDRSGRIYSLGSNKFMSARVRGANYTRSIVLVNIYGERKHFSVEKLVDIVFNPDSIYLKEKEDIDLTGFKPIPIEEYKDLYLLSEEGSVYSIRTKKIRSPLNNRRSIRLYDKNGLEKCVSIDNLLELTFGPPEFLNDFVDIKGYEGLYKIDMSGNIYSCKYHKIMSPTVTDRKYKCINLFDHNGNKKGHFIHRLVAQTFIYNPDPIHNNVVLHLDNDPSNCSVENLKYGTQSENMIQAYDDEILGEKNRTEYILHTDEGIHNIKGHKACENFIGCSKSQFTHFVRGDYLGPLKGKYRTVYKIDYADEYYRDRAKRGVVKDYIVCTDKGMHTITGRDNVVKQFGITDNSANKMIMGLRSEVITPDGTRITAIKPAAGENSFINSIFKWNL